MKSKILFTLLLFSVLSVLFSFHVSADAPTWGTYDFNEPKFVSVDDLDLTHQYFYQPSLTGNSGSVSSFPSLGAGSFNSYYLNTDLLYNNRYSLLPVASTSVSGYKYLYQSVRSMPAGDYVMLFTVYSSSSSYAGSYWYLTSYPGLESYITHYFRNGDLFESAVAYVPKEAGVYHFEVYITVPEDTQTCITYTYGYERVEYYYFDTVGTYSNPAFNGMVIYKIKDVDFTCNLSSRVYDNGLFTCDLTCLGNSNFDDLYVKQIYIDRDNYDLLPNQGAYQDSLIGLFSNYSSSGNSDNYAAFFDVIHDGFIAYLRTKIDDGELIVHTVAYELQYYFNTQLPALGPHYDVDSFLIDYYYQFCDDLGLLDEVVSAPIVNTLLSINYSDYVHSKIRANNYISSDYTITSPADYLNYQILGTTTNYYFNQDSVLTFNFNIPSLYSSYSSRSDFPSDNVLDLCFLIYNGDHCIDVFVCKLPVVQYFQSVFRGVGGSISDALQKTTTDISTLTKPDVDSGTGADDITRLQHAEFMQALIAELSNNISAGIDNIITAMRVKDFTSANYYSNTAVTNYNNYLMSAELEERFLALFQPEYTFAYNIPEGVTNGMSAFGGYFTDFMSNIGFMPLLTTFLSLGVISWFIYGRKG